MSEIQYRRLEVQEGDVVVLRMVDKKLLDETIIQAFANELFSFSERHLPKVVLSFQGVEFIASTVLTKLCEMDKKIKDAQGRWMICEVHPAIYEVFQITRLHNVLPFTATLEKALSQLA